MSRESSVVVLIGREISNDEWNLLEDAGFLSNDTFTTQNLDGQLYFGIEVETVNENEACLIDSSSFDELHHMSIAVINVFNNLNLDSSVGLVVCHQYM